MRLILSLAAVGFVAACMADEPVMDPSPQATLQDDITSPTDGLENETGPDGM